MGDVGNLERLVISITSELRVSDEILVVGIADNGSKARILAALDAGNDFISEFVRSF